MDPLFEALSLFKRRRYDKCVNVCTAILEKQPLDQSAWVLKMQVLTRRIYVDDIDSEEGAQETADEDYLDDSRMASAPRPGTSLKTVTTSTASMSSRPQTSTGRPLSGIARPSTASRPSTTTDRLKTTRPITGRSARAIRLGTAAMLGQKDGPFIQVSRLNINKYATDFKIAKPLFEYLFYHEGDVRNAMELAVQATKHSQFKDWWWKVQLGKCYTALNLIRDGEQQLRSALRQQHHIETFIRLIRIYIRLDQPLSAMEVCKSGLQVFPKDVSIMTEQARLHEALGDALQSVKLYRNIITEDAMNVEAIACTGLYHFYNYQPEVALQYYRRILMMGAHSAELFNNIGLCCMYSQQLDLTLTCFQRALDSATDGVLGAEIWYNLSHVAIGAGDIELAVHCLSLCLCLDANHTCALNNLAVLYHRLGKRSIAKSYLGTADALEPQMAEPKQNLNIIENSKTMGI